MILTVETTNIDKFEVLLNFLRVNGYNVKVNDSKLSENDWILPRKSASNSDSDELSSAMDNDIDEGTEANLFFTNLVKEINAWKYL